MTLGLTLTVIATAWLGTTTGVAALFASAVPVRHRREVLQAPRTTPAQVTPVRVPAGHATSGSPGRPADGSTGHPDGHPASAEDDHPHDR